MQCYAVRPGVVARARPELMHLEMICVAESRAGNIPYRAAAPHLELPPCAWSYRSCSGSSQRQFRLYLRTPRGRLLTTYWHVIEIALECVLRQRFAASAVHNCNTPAFTCMNLSAVYASFCCQYSVGRGRASRRERIFDSTARFPVQASPYADGPHHDMFHRATVPSHHVY